MSKAILVVEDDPDIRRGLRELLESEGYFVFTASNGKEALDRLKGSNVLPVLVLLDLMMPVMDGKTFLTELEKDSALEHLPVVVLTAATQSIENKVAGFMRKPVDIDKVLETAARYAGTCCG